MKWLRKEQHEGTSKVKVFLYVRFVYAPHALASNAFLYHIHTELGSKQLESSKLATGPRCWAKACGLLLWLAPVFLTAIRATRGAHPRILTFHNNLDRPYPYYQNVSRTHVMVRGDASLLSVVDE